MAATAKAQADVHPFGLGALLREAPCSKSLAYDFTSFSVLQLYHFALRSLKWNNLF